MPRQILFNAFDMNCLAHQSPGLWRHPLDHSTEFAGLGPWLKLATTLERGLFDALFLADVLGVYDVFGGSQDAAVAHGIQIPAHDPLLLVPALAAATRHLGFGVTVNLTYEPPYLLARRFSTLDHLSGGRVGWNIVTGYLDSAARALGFNAQRPHDDRYAVAEEYMEVVYRLWQESWSDDAVTAERAGLYANPGKVRRIVHAGEHYSLDAPHLCIPSPQRVPLLFQAGTSAAGRAFAGRHAECVFVSGPSEAVIAPRVAALRKAAMEAGRNGRDIRIFSLMTVILAATDAEARDKEAELRGFGDIEGALALLSGWTGIDFSALPPDQEVRHVENDAGRSALEAITRADPTRRWTVEEVARHATIGGIGPVIAGSPATVAERLLAWQEVTDVNGFNLAFATRPGSMIDVVDLLVPELQARGLYKTAYAEGTLREKLFGVGRARPSAPHPAAAYLR